MQYFISLRISCLSYKIRLSERSKRCFPAMDFKNFSGGGEPSPREFDEERSATVRFLAGSAPVNCSRNVDESDQPCATRHIDKSFKIQIYFLC